MLWLIGWLLPALACNLPVPPNRVANDAAQATLTALQSQTIQSGEASAYTPGSMDALQDANTAPSSLDVFPTILPQTPEPDQSRLEGNAYIYYTRSGDTRQALALRFGVPLDDIPNPQNDRGNALLPPGIKFAIPARPDMPDPFPLLLPDSEVVYSPTTAGFSVVDYVQSAGGFLSTYMEEIDGERFSGGEIVERAAVETSINPRVLLAFLEYRSGWVRGSPSGADSNRYPIGFFTDGYAGLYKELLLSARQLTIGYYGWRSGKTLELVFPGGVRRRLDPLLNPGSAAVQTLFAQLYSPARWQSELSEPGGFLAVYAAMFGDPWARAAIAGPLLPFDLAQPSLELPFQPGETWSLTGGPHPAWGVGSPWGGLDLAPASVEPGCTVSRFWVTSAASGLVIRSANGAVALDLDGDGLESTGWVLVFLHIAREERVESGRLLDVNERVGHPSCEGGVATGTHVHLARKYNGEWIAAGQPAPFLLSGWQAWEGEKAYSGALIRGDQVVTARPDGSHTSLITR